MGTVSTATKRWLTVFGIPVPKDAGMILELGSLSEVLDFPGPKNITKKVVFAASVLNDYSSFETIESLSEQLGTLTQTDSALRHIETPLLGTGAGGLSTEISGEALYRGFVAASSPEARMYLFVFDNGRKKLLEKLMKGLAKETPVQLAADLVLTPQQVDQFHNALLAAFTRSDLEQVTFLALGVPYSTIVGQGSFSDDVWSLVMWANRHNQVRVLLQQARRRNPGNVLLRSFADSLG
jgi:hypothetical protein